MQKDLECCLPHLWHVVPVLDATGSHDLRICGRCGEEQEEFIFSQGEGYRHSEWRVRSEGNVIKDIEALKTYRLKRISQLEAELRFWSDEGFVVQTFENTLKGMEELDRGNFVTLDELQKELGLA